MRSAKSELIPCLVYHRLHRGAGPTDPVFKDFSISVKLFAQHLDGLRNAGYTTALLSDFLSWQKGMVAPPERPLLITFDDGWASNHSLAWPELKSRGLTGTIFLTADRKAALFEESGELDRPLTETEIVELAENGVSIQSHGLTHQALTELAAADLLWEAIESRRIIEALTKQPVEWMAAPYGLSNNRVERVLRQAGYLGFAPGIIGVNRLESDAFQFRRLGVRPYWSAEELLERLSLRALRGAARVGNFKRRIRLFLGYERSRRLRARVRRSAL